MGTYDIERYLNVRSTHGASFGPDGDRLSFLMNTTGVSQVWTLEEPRGWPEQRTFYDERVTFADWSPERSELAFGMDEGGNERAQLFALDAESGEITNLTAMPEAKHRWGGWSRDGERFAFTSNRRDQAVFDVYVQGREQTGEEATLVHEGDGWLTVAGFSPDDSRLLVAEAYSNADQDLYSLELETGEFAHLTPHEGKIRHRSPCWASDGEGIYLVTDRDDDTLSLSYLDCETLEIETVVDGSTDVDGLPENRAAPDHTEWNVDGVSVHVESGRLVYSRNVDGYTQLGVATIDPDDPTTLEHHPTPEFDGAVAGGVRGGVAGGVGFTPDGERFACTVTSDTQNANVYVVDAETGESTRWTDAPTAGIPRETFRSADLVHVESFDGRTVPGFLTLPETHDAGETPVVVDIHGGPESQRRPTFSSVKQYLVNRGYAYFEPNVRGSSGYGAAYKALDDVEKRMDSVRDVAACVDWLHDHQAVDPDRIACMGGSYGGFMVLASMTEYPDLWAAGVDVVGIANFVTFLENTGDWRRKLREAEYGSLAEDRDFLESISPINTVENVSAPLFVLHGENDPRVPVGEAEQIVEEVEKRDVPVRKLIFDDEGHGFSKLENRIEAYSAIAEFLDEHV